ncbi:MAG: hypothetical protein JJU24_15495, partial [Natronohydrobacter sp.]|nr:hypothetical protein [Natronohydrobacter sp.]
WYSRRSAAVQITYILIKAARDNPERLRLLLLEAHEPVALKHWAFGQLGSPTGKATFMRGAQAFSRFGGVAGENNPPTCSSRLTNIRLGLHQTAATRSDSYIAHNNSTVKMLPTCSD